MSGAVRSYADGATSGGKRGRMMRQLLLRLSGAGALVLLAQVLAPRAEGWLQETALPDTLLPVLMIEVALLGPFAAGEALATWGGPVAGPLLRGLPAVVVCLLMAATLQLVRRLVLWMGEPLGRRTLREMVFQLPPLPLDREQRKTGNMRTIGVATAIMVWLGSAYALLNVLSRRVAEDLQVGNVVWQVESVTDAVKSTIVWALPVGMGWPDVLLLGLVLVWPFSPLALAVWHFVLVPMARRRWWQERLGPAGQGVSLSQGQAEAWLQMRQRWPGLLLAWWYGGGEAVKALDRAARGALQGRGPAGLPAQA